TTARMLLKLIEPTAGTIRFEGNDISKLSRAQAREFRQRVQPVFQDPYSSLNPMFTIERLIAEPLEFYKRGNRAERRARVRRLLDDVALPQSMLQRYPSELSGGQRQRAYVAMVLAQDTDVVLLDEPLNNLDMKHAVTMMAQLRRAADELGRTIVIVLHDINFAGHYANRICAMKDGRVVEFGTPAEIMTD
ncbi:ATP-binding cassette domain-containing protein, partial [Bacillus tequilensis]|nr:ATP-binding cassette domain-containing protein [Bacillus tequilensis]